MKVIYKSEPTGNGDRKVVTTIFETKNKTLVKFYYEARNGGEEFTGYSFVNNKWETIFTILNLGVYPDHSMYVCDENQKESRYTDLYLKAIELTNLLIK